MAPSPEEAEEFVFEDDLQVAAAAAPVPQQSEENLAQALLGVLLRGKTTILVTFAIVTTAVVIGTLRTPPLYEAESSLIVRMGREYVYRPEDGRNEASRAPSLSEMVNSEVEILSSRDLAEQVVRTLGVLMLYPEVHDAEPDPEKAVEMGVLRFRQALTVRPVLESSVIKVGFEHPEPQVAADAVNLLVARFFDKHVEVFGEERSSRLESQLGEHVEDLTRAETALAGFKRENGVSDLDQQRSLLLGSRSRLADELRVCELELAELRLGCPQQEEAPVLPELPPNLSIDMKQELVRQRHELEREERGLEPEMPDRLVEAGAMRLLELQIEESELLRNYNESNRQVQSVRAEIERVRTFLASAERRSSTYDEVRRRERETSSQALRAEIVRLDGEIELLVRAEVAQLHFERHERRTVLEVKRSDILRRSTELDGDLQALEQHETNLRQLERARTAAEAAVETYRQRVDEARIADELDREKRINVRPIEAAAAPIAPTGLPRNMKIALGGFVGLLAGAGLAVLMDLFRSR